MGTARMPTQGSCLPLVTTSISLPSMSKLFKGVRIEGVALMAIRPVIGAPLEMPPKMPPALLLANPCAVIWSLPSAPVSVAASNPLPISTALTALIPIKA